MCLGPSCTVLYSAPANYRVVHLVILLISLVLILTPTHCMQWRLIISDGSLQISGLQSNTFLTDLMTMVEGEVSNDEACEWKM